MELDVFHLLIWEPIWFEGTPFAINRVVVLMLLASAACIALFAIAAARARKSAEGPPKGIAMIAETGYLFVRNNIAVDVMGPDGARYTPFLASLFFFIFFANLLEIVPGINFPVTSRMAIPAALAVLSWLVYNFVGFKTHGFGYLKDTLFPPGVPWWVYIILTPIEFASVFIIRPLTLAIRLFANMLAGHVLLTVFFLFTHELITSQSLGIALSPITLLVACALILFELMVITIQAYIFTTLTAFYIGEALHGHGEHEEEHHDDTATQQQPVRHETELAAA